MPYVPRPVRFDDHDAWTRWLVTDQRAVADRPDVLTYDTDALTQPLQIAGAPRVEPVRVDDGTDSDWVVKLIDVYPDDVPAQPELGGYQLGIAMDIFRGRYRESLEHPSPIPANEAQRYRFALPNATTCSCRATASWCRCSRPGSRSTTATRRRSSRTSSSRSPRTTARRRSGSSATRSTRRQWLPVINSQPGRH